MMDQQSLRDANAAQLLLNSPGWRLLARFAAELQAAFVDSALESTDQEQAAFRLIQAKAARDFWQKLESTIHDTATIRP